MFTACPGRQKDIKVRYLKCPSCGAEVEFFSDEPKRRCPSCKKDVVYSEKDSCIYWCKAAKDCLMRF
ncbi:MAG: phosphohydrolase [Candidatus Omnitrophica bacterium]|nr:phosphohydrolase [Candidatus Omnitrophota bacterium]MDD5574226.1 phosphohydrolase [Candidatus Omnitrophota bacterium]